MATIKIKNSEGNWEDVAIVTQMKMEVEPIVLTGDQSYGCSGVIPSTYIKLFGDTVSTKDITSLAYMFWRNTNKKIPFNINVKDGSRAIMDYLFDTASNLEELPIINNAYPESMRNLFAKCYRLREIPEDYFDTWNFEYVMTYTYSNCSSIFDYCYSLRKIPQNFFNKFNASAGTSTGRLFYYYAFQYCGTLDEIVNLPIHGKSDYNFTSNIFGYTFDYCSRLKNLTFKTNEDSSPKIVTWKSQTLDLTKYVGYADSTFIILNHNSGITADKEVKDDATYQALKDDPDWFTTNIAYSRYNHDSAVATINSLPDASAYLATAGGTNTIKFKGASGSATDGGAINTLTEEEIAVAAAKGWTVTLV